MTHDVFVSYSSKDKAVADAVVAALENNDMRCWVAPRDIEPGADWGESIIEAINNCKLVLLIFSSHSNQSKRVRDEIFYAIAEEKTLIPFRIENLDPTGAMRLHLSSLHWLDAYHPSWQAHIERLIGSVVGSMGREVPISTGQAAATAPVLGPAERKKRIPWVWIGLAVVLLAVMGAAGVFWLGGRGDDEDLQPTALAYEPQVTSTETITHLPTQTEQTETSVPPQIIEREVLLNGYLIVPQEGYFLDPQEGRAWTELENLFLSLTEYDRDEQEIIPEAAESWTISADGRFYTFKIRSDIPWVLHTPGGETLQVLDENGNPRFVSAQDFVTAFQRTCDPRINSVDLWLSGLLKGCKEAREYEDPENFPEILLEEIGVRAIAEYELLIELEIPSAYFLSITSQQFLSAVPQWAIDRYGLAWTNVGNLPTNGRFVIDAWTPGERMRWVRNPLLPVDMMGKGNVDVIEFVLLAEEDETYALWLDKKVDYSIIPASELLNHRVNHAREMLMIFQQSIHLISFTDLEKSPFDNAHLRRAFAAAFDRVAYINDVLGGQGLAMKHLAPPDVIGAVPIDQVGVGYNLEFARAELSAAGYPNCQGMPEITLWIHPKRDKPGLIEIIRDWEESLNCPVGTITIVEDRDESNDLRFLTWTGDFPDQHNWVGTILNCEDPFYEDIFAQRSCNEIDDLMKQAAMEFNLSRRNELYFQTEEAFFGEEGETPVIPLIWSANYTAHHPWLYRSQPIIDRETFYHWSIDMDTKLAAKE